MIAVNAAGCVPSSAIANTCTRPRGAVDHLPNNGNAEIYAATLRS